MAHKCNWEDVYEMDLRIELHAEQVKNNPKVRKEYEREMKRLNAIVASMLTIGAQEDAAEKTAGGGADNG
jgi:predicted secreted Zn-dependent protease